MRLPIISLIALGLAGATAATASASEKFNVSVYGVQRYTNTQTETDVHPESCWSSQGTTVSRSVVKFHTAKPLRVTATRSGDYVNLVFPDNDLDIPIVADWEHSGETNREVRDCVAESGWSWVPEPIPIANNCHDTLTDRGYSLSISGGKIEATGSTSLVTKLEPFKGCPWGDMSLELYPAKARIRAALIMDSAENEMTLRGRTHSHSENPDGSGTSDIVEQTTVYVVFKKR